METADTIRQQDENVLKLVEKYPDLFQDNFIKLWSYIPQGWESIVDDLCSSIEYYLKNTKTFHKKTDLRSRFKRFLHKLASKFCNILSRTFDPYAPYRPKDKGWWTIPQEIQEKVEKSRRRKFQKKIYALRNKYFDASSTFYSLSPERVYIDQIKQKFGELRFYYTGGDDVVSGMVLHAERIASNTCPNTGNKKEL